MSNALSLLPANETHVERTNVMHSAGSAEWYTPREIIDAARFVMGGIGFDPASCVAAQAQVGATEWCGLDHPDRLRRDGLELPWTGRVFVNPPTPPKLWWMRAAGCSGFCGQMIYVSYSVEPLSQSQLWTPDAPMLAWSVCVPKRRVPYMCTVAAAFERTGETLLKRMAQYRKLKDSLAAPETSAELTRLGRMVRALQMKLDRLRELDFAMLIPGPQPTHASAIVGVGVSHERFVEAFGGMGSVTKGALAR